MPRQSSRFQDEMSRIESEYNIQRMEAEIEYHRKMSMTFAHTVESEQERLSRITRRQRRSAEMQNSIRDRRTIIRGDDFE